MCSSALGAEELVSPGGKVRNAHLRLVAPDSRPGLRHARSRSPRMLAREVARGCGKLLMRELTRVIDPDRATISGDLLRWVHLPIRGGKERGVQLLPDRHRVCER